MRYPAFLLLLAVGSVNAATLDVAVSQGTQEPARYSYQLNDDRHTLDLRDSERYTVAVRDKVRKKDICREAEYRTGMVVNLRKVDQPDPGQYMVEVVGQVSSLQSLEQGEALSCGTNMVPHIDNRAFSDTSVIQAGKPKVIVVDGKTTLLLTVTE